MVEMADVSFDFKDPSRKYSSLASRSRRLCKAHYFSPLCRDVEHPRRYTSATLQRHSHSGLKTYIVCSANMTTAVFVDKLGIANSSYKQQKDCVRLAHNISSSYSRRQLCSGQYLNVWIAHINSKHTSRFALGPHNLRKYTCVLLGAGSRAQPVRLGIVCLVPTISYRDCMPVLRTPVTNSGSLMLLRQYCSWSKHIVRHYKKTVSHQRAHWDARYASARKLICHR